jgi:hypothetical protein
MSVSDKNMYNCTLYSSVSLPRLGAVLNKRLGCLKRVCRTVTPHMYNDLPGGTVLSSPPVVIPTLWEQNDHK